MGGEHGSNNPFPHDGEGKPGHSCTGYGCDCDEKNYGHYSGGSSSGGSGATAIFLIAVVVCSIIGVFNQLLAALIIIIVGFILLIN